MAFPGGSRKRKERVKPEVPAAFRELFSGATEEQLPGRLRQWLEVEYGSAHAAVYWLCQLAAGAERETVRLDAIEDLVELLHGVKPQAFVAKAEEKDKGHASPAELTPHERAAQLLDVLQRVGAIPGATQGS